METKKYFTMGEVAHKAQLPEYTIRYWETKFRHIRPLRLSSGHRRYTQADLDTLQEVKDLVFIKGYSLDGARKALSMKRRQKKAAPALPEAPKITKTGLLEEIRKDLRELIKEL